MRLAVIILTKNEADNIAGVVQNVRQISEEVIVIDSGSTDGTVEKAMQNGAQVYYRAWDEDFAAQRNYGLEMTTADWVLYVDADERLYEEAVTEIKAIVRAGKNQQYRIKRKVTAFGHTFNYGVLGSEYVTRLFPRGSVKWVGKVHEHAECGLSVGTIGGVMEHNTYRSYKQYEEKMQHYSGLWAREKYERGVRVSSITPIIHASLGFIKMYVIKLGFLDGLQGLYTCLNYAQYEMMKYLKLQELQSSTTPPL